MPKLGKSRASFESTYNSGEDVTNALVSSEVDERQSLGTLASPLFTQKREASAAQARIYHSDRKFCVTLITHREPNS